MRAECTRLSNRRTARAADCLGALPKGAIEGREPTERAAPGEPDGASAGFTAIDEELVGGAEDATVTAVAPVGDRGLIGPELLTPRWAAPSSGRP